MKKTYTVPQATTIKLHLEANLLDSSSPTPNNELSNQPQFSNDKTWDSDNWTDMNEED